MLFSELAGDAIVDPKQTIKQISGWFRADDRFVIVGMRSLRGVVKKNVISQVVVASEFVQQLRSPSGAELLESLSLSDDGTRWDVYFSVATVDTGVSLNRRGDLDAIKDVPGVYVDLDIKPGSFETKEDALAFLRTLPRPTIITDSGSGGLHGYWKFPQPLDADAAAKVQRSWYSLLSERADPVSIDHLVDASRVMRLAGSIRWPKPDEELLPSTATTVYRDLTNLYEPDKLLEWSAEAHQRTEERIRSTRARDAARKISPEAFTGAVGEEGSWSRLMAVADVEDRFAELVSWDDVLCPLGWTFLREDRQRRREFARPGSSSKSATCDWPDSPNVLSLHSWSPDTGLSDLKEAGIVLTKFRVAQRLLFNDSYADIVNWTLEHG